MKLNETRDGYWVCIYTRIQACERSQLFSHYVGSKMAFGRQKINGLRIYLDQKTAFLGELLNCIFSK